MIKLSNGQSLFASLYLFCLFPGYFGQKEKFDIESTCTSCIFVAWSGLLYRETETEKRDRLEFIL